MSRHPKKKMKADFEQAVAGEAYYAILGVTPAEDEPGKWDVSFRISGSRTDPEAFSPLDCRDVRRLLYLYFAFSEDKPRYEGEAERNVHVARVDSKARAERLACELVYVLQDAGLDPMKEEKGLYQPMAPDTSRIKFPKPPRPGLF